MGIEGLRGGAPLCAPLAAGAVSRFVWEKSRPHARDIARRQVQPMAQYAAGPAGRRVDRLAYFGEQFDVAAADDGG